MKRQKTVFQNNELAHLWVHETQQHGRNPGETFYFEGKTIYSYGYHFPIATISEKDNNVIFWNDNNYSPTTNRHQSYVSQSIPSEKRIIYLPFMEIVNAEYRQRSYGRSVKDFQRKTIEYYINELDQLALKHKRATKYSYAGMITQIFQRFIQHVEYFQIKSLLKKDERDLFNNGDKSITDLIEGKTNLQDVRSKKRKKESEEQKNRFQSQMEIWTGTKNVKFKKDKTYLRINGENIQSNKGANVPLTDAKKIWKYIVSGRSIHGLQIGFYTITSFNGTLKIGCHEIDRAEVERIGKQL